jgi:hypothetical protein
LISLTLMCPCWNWPKYSQYLPESLLTTIPGLIVWGDILGGMRCKASHHRGSFSRNGIRLHRGASPFGPTLIRSPYVWTSYFLDHWISPPLGVPAIGRGILSSLVPHWSLPSLPMAHPSRFTCSTRLLGQLFAWRMFFASMLLSSIDDPVVVGMLRFSVSRIIIC